MKARTNDIIFCANAVNIPGEGASANTILSAINPEYIPTLYSFSTVITILGYDHSVDHSIRVTFGRDGFDKGTVDGSIPKIIDDSNLPEEYKGVNLAINWNNFDFKSEGIYLLTVEMDGVEIGQKEIYVKGRNQK